MARKRRDRKNTGLFEVPDRRHDSGETAENDSSVGVFGGPTQDSHLLGGPGHHGGLFDAQERTPGDMPGLFDRPAPASGDGRSVLAKPGRSSGTSVGLFDKPRRDDRA